MERESQITLRERAILTWKHERPKREALRLLRKAEKLEKVRQKLIQIIGSEENIEIGINSKGDVIAVVEDLQFTTYSYDDDLLHIVPIVNCPVCGRDVSLGFIDDLAELGERLELLEAGYRHTCRI